MPNNIAFYVEGDEQYAKRLKLVANVNDIPSVQTLRIQFMAAVEKLITEALGCSVPPQLIAAINGEKSISIDVSGKKIIFVKESWPSQHGYELRFYLSNHGSVGTDASAP